MSETIVKLSNVRLSFPALWTARKGPEATSKAKFSGAFILNKKTNAKDIAAVQAVIAQIVKDEFKGKAPPKICLRDGSEKGDTNGYGPDVMFLNASSESRPQVVDRDMTPLVEEDGRPYAGCYVNATIRLWKQDNQFGKRINAALRAVQYVTKGEPFGGDVVDVNKEFSALPTAEEDVM